MFRNGGFRDTSQYFCLHESPETRPGVTNRLCFTIFAAVYRIFTLNRSSTKISKRYLSCVQTEQMRKFSLMFDFFFFFCICSRFRLVWKDPSRGSSGMSVVTLSSNLLTKRVTLQYFFHLFLLHMLQTTGLHLWTSHLSPRSVLHENI